MLVLTRKPQEKIQIGDDITITVIKTKGKGVRIGIEAPGHVPVLRGELTAGNRDASPTAPAQDESQQPSGGEPEVRFARTSRSRVPTLLPDLLGEAGPLREMLARRAETTV